MKDFDIDKIKEPGGEYDAQKDFTTLACWSKAREVKLSFLHDILPKLPQEEKFGLGNQIRSAIISTTANIAEGYGRFHHQESIQFYRISRGSLYELKDHLITCLDYKFISDEIFKDGTDKIEKAKISLGGYINYKRKQIIKDKA